MGISIFAKKPFRAKSDGHLQRVSSIIRGTQIAERINAQLNPETGYKDDICIYVKPHVKVGEDFIFEGRSSYLDVIDGPNLLLLMNKYPRVNIIACSYNDFEYITQNTSNPVYLIPQHHCNFEKEKRSRQEVTTIGCIGTPKAFHFLPPLLKEELNKRGLTLMEFSHFTERAHITEFYKQIDIQIIWRPYMKERTIPLSNPLKIVNAASYGIPTIALDEPTFEEMRGCYIGVDTIQELLKNIDALRNNSTLYEEYSQTCLDKSNTYHIDTIAQLYKALK